MEQEEPRGLATPFGRLRAPENDTIAATSPHIWTAFATATCRYWVAERPV